MRRLSAASSTLAAIAAGVGLALFGLGFAPHERLIWNPTGSAPKGLYWLSDGPVSVGRWAAAAASLTLTAPEPVIGADPWEVADVTWEGDPALDPDPDPERATARLIRRAVAADRTDPDLLPEF